jgi:uncharacterized protein DUF5670
MALNGDRLLWPGVIVLVFLWALGVGSANAMGGLIYLLLVVALVVILVRLVRGRRLL